MTERARILVSSIAIMVTVAVCVAAAAITVLHHVSFQQHRDRLVQMVQHRARLLQEVSDFDTTQGAERPTAAAKEAGLNQILEVFATFGTFGETGEMGLARREGDQIVWLVEQRHVELERPHSTPFDSPLAEPMKRALSGKSGALVGLDYRGERVLAAYTAVPGLGWGVVAKMDMAEINRPFFRAALLCAAIAIVVTALGVMLMLWVASPLIGRIESRVAERTAQLSKALDDQEHLQEQLRSAASETALAEERERRKLAVDLHDGLGQLLTASGMRLALLRDSLPDPALVAKAREIEEVIAEADERVSSLSFALSPPLLHDMGILAAAQRLAEDIELRFGLHVVVEEEGKRRRLDEATRSTLFGAVREALLNVRKHAGTDKALVRVLWTDRLVTFTVEDKGVGFDPEVKGKGYGLLSIGERLNHLGGSVQIESAPGEGTRICLAAPVRAARPKKAGRPKGAGRSI